MHSHYGLDYVLKRQMAHINKLLVHAIEHSEEEKTQGLWVSMYPFMMMGWQTFMPYSDFRNKLLSKPHQASTKPLREIEDEMDRVIAQYESKKAVN